jgi:hypothetical protein
LRFFDECFVYISNHLHARWMSQPSIVPWINHPKILLENASYGSPHYVIFSNLR